MSRGKYKRNGYGEVTVQTTEISEYLEFEFYNLVWWSNFPDKPNATDCTMRLGWCIGIYHRVDSCMCYWIINETRNLMSKTSVEHVTRNYYLKSNIKSRNNDINKKLTERLDGGNFRLNADAYGEFDFILLDQYFSKNLGVDYASGITPMDETYDDIIVEGRPENEEEVIYNYLNMNLIFDVCTNNEHLGTVVKHSLGLDDRGIGRLHTNPFFYTREYEK